MYTYVSAHVVSAKPNSQFETIDISTTQIVEVFRSNRLVYIKVTHPAVQDPFFVSLEELRVTYSQSLDYIQDLLTSLGDRALTVVEFTEGSSIKYAKYSDARRAKYRLYYANLGQNYPENYPTEDLLDIMMTRPDYQTDMRELHTHCMLSVNGFYHQTGTDGENAFIMQGGKSTRVANKNTYGIWSFRDIGRIEKIAIREEDIMPSNPDKDLKDKIKFIVDADLTDKSVFLTLGGYLVFLQEGVFTRTDENTFLLDLKNLPYVARIMESKNYIDLSSLELTEPVDDNTTYDVGELFSDAVIRRYLTLSQTFLVVVDSPSLSICKMELRETRMHSMFTTYQEPWFPLIIGSGRQVEYWRKQEEGVWALLIGDESVKNYTAIQQPYPPGVINDSINSDDPVVPQHPMLLSVSNV